MATAPSPSRERIQAGFVEVRRVVGASWRSVLAGLLCLAGVAVYAAVVDEKTPLESWLSLRLGLVFGYVALFELACVSTGWVVVARALGIRKAPLVEAVLMSKIVGLSIFGSLYYVAGALGLFRGWFALVMASIMALVGLPDLVGRIRMERRVRRHARPARPVAHWIGVLATCFGGMGLLLLYLQSMTPDAINFDASWYHLPIAEDYAREGRLVPFYGDYNRAFPHLMSVVFTWGFVLPGLSKPLAWMMATHLELAMVVWKCVGVAAAARWMLGGRRLTGSWAVFFLFPGIFVYDQNPGGSADHFLGAFAVPAFLAAVRAMPRLDKRYLALLGVVLGGALLTKTQSIYLVGATGALLGGRALQLTARALIRRFRPVDDGAFVPTWKQLLAAVAIVAGLAAAISAPHFVKNFVYYKNPLYPFAMRWFESFPEHARSADIFRELYPNLPHKPKGVGLERHLNALKLFFTFALDPHYSFTKGVPVTGALFSLLLAPAVLLRRAGRIWLGVAASFVAILIWAETYTGDRYLQGLLPIPIATTAALIVRLWSVGYAARVGVTALVLFQVVYGGDAPFYSGDKRIQASIRLINSSYEGRRTDEARFGGFRREHLAIARHLPRGASVYARNYRTTLGVDRAWTPDNQSWQSWVFYEPMKSPGELWDALRERGFTHLARVRNKRPSETLQGTLLLAELIRQSKDCRGFGAVEICGMPEQRPELESPYLVAVREVSGYPDGLYELGQLIRYDRDTKGTFNAPSVPLEPLKRGGSFEELAARAQAVVVGPKSKTPIPDAFVLVEQLPKQTLHLRKLDDRAPETDAPAPAGDDDDDEQRPPDDGEAR